MKKFQFLFILLFVFSLLSATQIDTLFILQTTDVHGNLYPYDYFKDEPAERGLAKVYTRVAEYRDLHENVILVDSGDMIQGTPLTYYFNKIEPDITHPMILAMNLMKYDAFAVGNHEIEQGTTIYNRVEKESDFPWLSANSFLEDGSTFFKPYTIIEKGGYKIGIIGLTTPGIPMWIDEALYPGITWKDMVETAKIFVAELRSEVDILIGIFHSGFDENEGAYKCKLMGLPIDNASGLVAKNVSGFDVIFGGHSHHIKPKERQTITNPGKTLQIISGCLARNIGVAKLIIETNDKHCRIIEKSSWIESIKDKVPSDEILEITKDHHNKVLKYIRTDIGITNDTLSGKHSRIKDTPLVDLINKAQLEYTNADISFAACFNSEFNISPGKIKIKDIYSLYEYENFLYMIEITGRQIKDYLEYSARYFIWDGENISSDPKIAGYNYDMAEGLSYQIDVSEDIGNRIKYLSLIETGKPIDMNRVYKVALNSYRGNGGGGHLAAAKAENAPVIFKSNIEMRSIIIEYISKIGIIKTEINNNWEIIH